MHSRKVVSGIQKPLTAVGSRKGGAARLRIDQYRIFLNQSQLKKKTSSQRHAFLISAASNLSGMAQSVLAKPHRFILVSDLDWTMVSVMPLRGCKQGQAINIWVLAEYPQR